MESCCDVITHLWPISREDCHNKQQKTSDIPLDHQLCPSRQWLTLMKGMTKLSVVRPLSANPAPPAWLYICINVHVYHYITWCDTRGSGADSPTNKHKVETPLRGKHEKTSSQFEGVTNTLVSARGWVEARRWQTTSPPANPNTHAYTLTQMPQRQNHWTQAK